jgi:hypothetical protein
VVVLIGAAAVMLAIGELIDAAVVGVLLRHGRVRPIDFFGDLLSSWKRKEQEKADDFNGRAHFVTQQEAALRNPDGV